MELRIIADERAKGMPCNRCCLTDKCSGASDKGHQIIDGTVYRCDRDNIYYALKDSIVEDLKKSVVMMVKYSKLSKPEKMRVIHIEEDMSGFDIEGSAFFRCEEIKEPTWRPFNFEKDNIPVGFIGVTIHSKLNSGTYQSISGISKDGFSIHGIWHPFDIVFQEWETLDGKPIGIKE